MTGKELEEFNKRCDEIDAALKRNVEAVEEVGKLRQAAEERDANIVTLTERLVKIEKHASEAETAMRELREKTHTQRMAADPAQNKREALAMLGMMGRKVIANHERTEVPPQFREEGETLERYFKKRAERATINADATGGSYTIPTLLEDEIVDTLEEVSDLISRTDFQPGLPGNVDIPTLTGRPTLQPKRTSVDTKMTQSDPAIGQMVVRPDEAYIYFPADNRLMLMEAVQLGRLLQQLLRDGAIEGLADWLLNADGTSAYNGITGILNEATAAYVQVLAAGTTFVSLTKQDLTNTMADTLKRGRQRGVWVGNLGIRGLIEDMDRTGKVPVVRYANDGTTLVLGQPFVTDEGMPGTADTAADTAFLGFGDLATYLVGMQGGMQIGASTEYLFGRNQTAFRNVMNVDIVRKPVKTFKIIKTNP